MPRGAFRVVLLIGRCAVKLPRPRYPLLGMRCNRWEREVWRVWRPRFNWMNLCPILRADPFGLFVVMPRASRIATAEEFDAEKPGNDSHPMTPDEGKPGDYGWIDGRLLAIDYGLPDADLVRERRTEYERAWADRRGNRRRRTGSRIA